MKFTLSSLWFLAFFLGYWASIVLAYPVWNPSTASLSIRADGIEARPVHLSRSWTRSDDFEDLEARKLVQKIKDLHHKHLSRGAKHGHRGHSAPPIHIQVHKETVTKVDPPSHVDNVFWKKLPLLPINKPLPPVSIPRPLPPVPTARPLPPVPTARPLPQIPNNAQRHRHSGFGVH